MKLIVSYIDKLIGMVAATALVAATMMILLNVFNRYVVLGWLREGAENSAIVADVFRFTDGLISPISATVDEIPGLLLVWIAFLGAYLAYRRGGHISFDMLLDHVSAGRRRFIIFMSGATIIGFLGMLLWQSVRMIIVDGETEIETAEIAQGWFMSILPIASVLLTLALVLDISSRQHDNKDSD